MKSFKDRVLKSIADMRLLRDHDNLRVSNAALDFLDLWGELGLDTEDAASLSDEEFIAEYHRRSLNITRGIRNAPFRFT